MTGPIRCVIAIVMLLAACTTPSGESSASPAGGYATTAAGFALASWTTTITADDLHAGGVTDPEMVDQNSGRMVLTYRADGTWTLVQTSLTGISLWEPIFRGTYTVDRDRVTHVVTFPERYAAEGGHDTCTWRIEADTLILNLVDSGDEFIEVVYEAHPWQLFTQ